MPQRLRQGMLPDEVRQLLQGWRESPPSAILSPDKTHLYSMIDFIATAREGGVVRLTFDNGKLLIWGEPAAPE